MRRRLKLKKGPIIVTIILIIVFVIIINKMFFSNKSKLIGSWTTDNNTIYEFYKNNTGKLIVSLSEYDFKYSLKNNILYIDFINEKSEDTKYKYNFSNKKLVLKNKNGIFTFTKK